MDGNGRAVHLAAGALVADAHGGNVIVAQKAEDQVALAPEILSLPFGQVALLQGTGEQVLQRQHLRNGPQGEQAAHQDQQTSGGGQQRLFPALGQPGQQLLRGQARHLQAGVHVDQAQDRGIVSGLQIKVERPQIFPLPLIPGPVTAADEALFFRGIFPEAPAQALLHHVVQAVVLAVGQAAEKGVALRERPHQLPALRQTCDKGRLLGSELIGQAHTIQKIHPLLGQWVQHGLVEHLVDVVPAGQQRSVCLVGLEIQIDRGKPPLAGLGQVGQVSGRQRHAAPAAVSRDLLLVQSQVPGGDLVQVPAQAKGLAGRQDLIPRRHDEMERRSRQTGQGQEQGRDLVVLHQVVVVQEEVVVPRPVQQIQQTLRQQAQGRVPDRKGHGVQLPGQGRAPPGCLKAAPEKR